MFESSQKLDVSVLAVQGFRLHVHGEVLVRRLKNGSTTADLGHDGLGGGRPDERVGVRVVERDIGVDGGDQVGHAAEDTTSEAPGGQLPEPALDQVQPGRNWWG